jgi:hypothetical protein
MANPATLSIGTRIVFTPGFIASAPPLNPAYSASVPSIGNPTPAVAFGLACEIVGMTTNPGQALPGLCQTVSGSAPDFTGSVALVHDLAGQPFRVVMGLNQASWVTAGSPMGQRRWQYCDLTA